MIVAKTGMEKIPQNCMSCDMSTPTNTCPGEYQCTIGWSLCPYDGGRRDDCPLIEIDDTKEANQ